MSDFIIAKSGEHFTYNSFGCSVPFYTETISLEHLHSLAFLSLLELSPSSSDLSFPVCFVASCPFFCLSTIGIPSLCSPGRSHPTTTCIPWFLSLYLSVWPFFQVSCVSISTPQAFTLPRAWVHFTSFCMSHLSVGCYPVPRPGASEQLWPSVYFIPHVQSVTKTWWWHLPNVSLFTVHTAIALLNDLVSCCYKNGLLVVFWISIPPLFLVLP